MTASTDTERLTALQAVKAKADALQDALAAQNDAISEDGTEQLSVKSYLTKTRANCAQFFHELDDLINRLSPTPTVEPIVPPQTVPQPIPPTDEQ